VSREVLGSTEGLDTDASDVPTGVIALRPRDPAPSVAVPLDDAAAVGATRTTSRPSRHGRRSVALGAGLLVAAGVVGWFGPVAGSASGLPRDPPAATPAAAVVLDVRPDRGLPEDLGRPWIVTARIEVASLGHQGITVTGTGAPITAAEPTHLTPASLTVPAGARRVLAVSVRLTCGSPQQLDLPGLRVQRADGVRALVPVDGAAAELTSACGSVFPDQVIRVERVVRDDRRLRVDLTVPGGRTARIQGISAWGVALTGRPLPADIDGQVRSIWLDPPAECAPIWLDAGLPTTLDLTLSGLIDSVHAATRSHRRVVVDVPLARWLLETACLR